MGRGLTRSVAGWILALSAVCGEPQSIAEEGEPQSIAEDVPVLDGSGSSLLRREEGAEPWLGVSVHKPEKERDIRMEGVPAGVGFVVHRVAEGGPAARAGLQQDDVLWKLGDQMLVNEAQFLVLLHLHEVGERVTLTYQRGRENHELEVVLGERPGSETGREEADVAVLSAPTVPGLPKQVIDVFRQEASIMGEDNVTVRLERKGEGFHWQQLDGEGKLMLEGPVNGVDDIPEGANEGLASKLRALIRAFEDAEKRARSGVSSPRVRRVPRIGAKREPNPR